MPGKGTYVNRVRQGKFEITATILITNFAIMKGKILRNRQPRGTQVKKWLETTDLDKEN